MHVHVFLNFIILGTGHSNLPRPTLILRKQIFICKIKKKSNACQCIPRMHKKALKRTSEFKEYGYVLVYKALLISIGTHILEASQTRQVPIILVRLSIRILALTLP